MSRVLTVLLIILAAGAATIRAQNDPTAITPFATPEASARADSGGAPGPPAAAVTAIIFQSACRRCHGSARPAIGLSLRRENFAAAMIDVPSREKPEFKLVDTENPEQSYLLKKLRGDEDTIGERMPLGADPLPEHAIVTIEAWILEVSAAAADTAAAPESQTPEAQEGAAAPEAQASPEAADDAGTDQEAGE